MVVIASMLFFSVMFVSESFAQVQQCNGLDATRIGSNNRDIIRGTSGDDVIVALGGNDLIFGNGGNDVICGGAGNDRIYGNSGNDILIGQAGSDRLNGGSGNDSCDSSSEDGRIRSCENQYQESTTNNSNDLQKQINDLQTQIKNIILGLINWADIQGVPESLADGDDDMLAKMKCDADQILVFDGVSWVCDDIQLVANTAQTCQGDLVNFAGLFHGDSIEDIQKYLTPYGMTVSATGYGKNPMNTVIIYDSNDDDGKDSDLEVGIGNLVIIPDKIKKPSDSGKGGKQVYEFVPPRKIHSIEIVDIESDESGTVTAFNEGVVIGTMKLPVTGNKAHKTLTMNFPDVSKLVIDYNSSGGITNLCFSENEEPTNLECEENQILVFDGNQWVCSDNLAAQADTLSSLDCNIDEIAKWNGFEWECSRNITKSTPMSFHFSPIGTGGTVWTGLVSTVFDKDESGKLEVIITTSGEITNLISKTTAPMALSPPENESYFITLVKNGEDTSLTCMISAGKEMCDNTESKVTVDFGDTIILKTQASQFAPFTIIRSSVLFSSN